TDLLYAPRAFLPRSSVLADAEMVYSCCTRVSTAKVTEPIIGYKMQEKSLPCVKAVIFQTKQGDFCSDWRQPWVERKDLHKQLAAHESSMSKSNENTSVC
uniref:Chemokine (C-C motif) ligand 34b, duplicate 3 n=1 Tax=Sinocyclocheilus anshuiensis TaxID=1608454 RepID=A0A671N0R4_9TELE